MDPKLIGKRIENLRKKSGMTQQALAQKLNVTDKAISKWENGLGYPDITFLPKLSAEFGVTVDYLIFGEKQGIAVAGNIITDIVKSIDLYPKMGMLSFVTDITYAVGGCVPNTAINLAKIDQTIPIYALGKVGSDDNGRFVISQLMKNGIVVDGISYSSDNPSSSCDVMSVPAGERTFFHNKGANAEFSPEDIDIDSLSCKMLHIGYVLLLDAFDKPHKEYGTVMAEFLHRVQKAGIQTSIDVVSDSTVDYGEKIIPSLKYCNYIITNEVESCKIWGLEAYNQNGELNRDNIRMSMEKTRDAGVSDKVIVHSKTHSFILNVKTGEFTESASLKIPSESIKGSVGAGDAFSAGCLYAIYNDFADKDLLDFASAAAACSLFAVNSTDGMRSKSEIFLMLEKYERLEL